MYRLRRVLSVVIACVMIVVTMNQTSVRAKEEKDFSEVYGTYMIRGYEVKALVTGFLDFDCDELCGGVCVVEYNPEVLQFNFGYEIGFYANATELSPGKICFRYYAGDAKNANCENDAGIIAEFIPIGLGDTGLKIVDAYGINAIGDRIEIQGEVNRENAIVEIIQPDCQYDENVLTVTGDGYVCNDLLPENYWDTYAMETKELVLEGNLSLDLYTFTGYTALEKVIVGDDAAISLYMLPEKEELTIVGAPMSSAEFVATRMGYEFIPSKEVIKGDLDLSGFLNASDALGILEMAVDVNGYNIKYGYTADVNGDDLINAEDALAVLEIAAGLR